LNWEYSFRTGLASHRNWLSCLFTTPAWLGADPAMQRHHRTLRVSMLVSAAVATIAVAGAIVGHHYF
jgi:hypothetical protein